MKQTRIIKTSIQDVSPENVHEAVEVLRRGGLVAFPTETVYGLGADVYNVDAVKKVFETKGRPSDNPLIVHIAEFGHVHDLAKKIPLKAKLLIEKFWPGPLTLVVERSSKVSDSVTGGLDTVAIRMPKHPIALALVQSFGRGIVGPSANLSGSPSPTRAEHVYADLHGKIDMILDAGPTEIGVESTIVDVTVDPPLILRFGGLERERIEDIIGEMRTTVDIGFLKRSPGTRHRHYAPHAKVILVDQGDVNRFGQLLDIYTRKGKKIACIVHSRRLKIIEPSDSCFISRVNLQTFSQSLYATFRHFDQLGVDCILVEGVPEEGIGAAVMDRLRRAENAAIETREHVHPYSEFDHDKYRLE